MVNLLGHPRLHELPCCMGSHGGGVGCRQLVLRREDSGKVGRVDFYPLHRLVRRD